VDGETRQYLKDQCDFANNMDLHITEALDVITEQFNPACADEAKSLYVWLKDGLEYVLYST
jgi:hypothetical protein